MRRSYRHGLALIAATGLLLAGCGDAAQDDPTQDDPTQGEPTSTEQAGEGDTGEDPAPDGQELEDPNDDIEDGVYRGNGVALPVPEGWTLEPTAFQQGIVAAVSEDGSQQLTARAVDVEAATPSGQEPPEFGSLLDSVRQQVPQEPDVDEEVELTGADRAHRLTYLALPPQQEGAPESSVTLVLAADGQGLIGEFVFSATTDTYDEETADLLLAQAGFDPDSEPPAAPPPQQ